MNRAWILGALLVLLVGLAWSFLWPTATITNYPSSGTDIIAFGDSLVTGVGATQNKGFVSLLSDRLGVPIVNLGVPGNTTADGVARLNELDQYHPKVVILLLGGNDYLKHVPAEETFENLEKIIANIESRGAIVVLLGVRGGLLVDHFDSEFKRLHNTYHTAYVSNVLDGLLGDTRYMADSVHPNDDGYKIIADRVYPVLQQLLQ